MGKFSCRKLTGKFSCRTLTTVVIRKKYYEYLTNSLKPVKDRRMLHNV
jgi:hypothetical protein